MISSSVREQPAQGRSVVERGLVVGIALTERVDDLRKP